MLPRPRLRVFVLRRLPRDRAAESSGDSGDGLPGAAAELMAQHAAGNAAEDHAESHVLVAFDLYGLDAGNTTRAHFLLAHLAGGRWRRSAADHHRRRCKRDESDGDGVMAHGVLL